MPSAAHSSTIFLKSSMLITPWRRCISSRGQNTHFALQRFVLSIWTMSGRCLARSRPVASSARRTYLALATRAFSATDRTRRVSDTVGLAAPRRLGSARHRLELAAAVLDHAAEDLFEADRRRIADETVHFCQTRDPARHVLEAGFIGLLVRNQHDVRRAAGHRLHARREVPNRDF